MKVENRVKELFHKVYRPSTPIFPISYISGLFGGFLPIFSYILQFSPMFSYISEKSSLQNFSLHKFLFFWFLWWTSQKITLKRLTITFEHNIPFRHCPFGLVTRSFLILILILTEVGHFWKTFVWFQCQWMVHPQLCHFWKIIVIVCCCNERALVLTFSPLSVCLRKASTSNTKIISGLRGSDKLKITFQLLKERVRLLLLL